MPSLEAMASLFKIMNYNIRQATENDIEKIFELIMEFVVFQKSTHKIRITLQQMKADAALFKGLVAETENKEIVGFASYYFTYFSWYGKGLYLDDLYVREPYRKQKIGFQLLQSIIAIAKEADCKKVRWQVSNWNKDAIEFYKQMGAVIDDVDINCDLFLEEK